MFVKNRYWQIFLITIVCVHFICPLFCATYGQKICSDMQSHRAETDATCCIKINTDTTNDSGTPSENGTACCLDGLERILPIETNNIETVRESAVQRPISQAQLVSILSTSQQQLHNLPVPPKLPDAHLSSVISHRGPPLNRS